MSTKAPEMATRARARRGFPERRAVRLDHLDDDRLALAVARHGAPAFELLYERLAPRVYGFCCSMLHDPAEAEDALQETMTRAYRALSRPRQEMQVKPWLFTIARNACIDRIRRSEDRLEGPVEELLDQVPSAQDSAEHREQLRVLIADLASLSEAQRTALALREMSGFAHEEIAVSLDTTPARVKSLISEARRGLAERAVGREMPCEELRRTVAERGGRALRGTALRAHVEGCEACEAFVEDTRQTRSLALLAPLLPAAESKSILTGVLGGGGAGIGGSGGAGGLLSALGAKQLLALVAVAGSIGGGIAATDASEVIFGDGSGDEADPSAAGSAQAGEASDADGPDADPRREARGDAERSGAGGDPDRSSPAGPSTDPAGASAPATASGETSGGGTANRLLDEAGSLGNGLLDPIGGAPDADTGDLIGSLEPRVEAPNAPESPEAPGVPQAPAIPGASDVTEGLGERLGRTAPLPDAPSLP